MKTNKAATPSPAETIKLGYKSDAFEAIHQSAAALAAIGALPKATLRDFDERCLIQIPQYAPSDVQRIRLNNHLSQPVFAMYLNTSESTVQQWERGSKRPSGMACRLLSVIERHGLSVLV
jgi:putative transcriptional regulator